MIAYSDQYQKGANFKYYFSLYLAGWFYGPVHLDDDDTPVMNNANARTHFRSRC